MFKLFNKAKKKESKDKGTKSLDDVLRDKDAETRKLDEEESQYMERRKERGRKIIQIEKEELTRREDEVHVLRGEFDKVRKKNEEAEDKIQAQIKELQLQLDDMRLEHRSCEGSLEKDINTRKDTIADLKQTIVRRQTELGLLEENERKMSSVTLTSAAPLTKMPSYERRSSIIVPTAPAHNPYYRGSSVEENRKESYYPSLDLELENVHVPSESHVSPVSHVSNQQPVQLGAIPRTPIPFVQAAPRTRKKHMDQYRIPLTSPSHSAVFTDTDSMRSGLTHKTTSSLSLYSTDTDTPLYSSFSEAPTLPRDYQVPEYQIPVPSPRMNTKPKKKQHLSYSPKYPSMTNLPDLSNPFEDDILPSVPETDPGLETRVKSSDEDIFFTLSRPKKDKKRARAKEAALL